MHACRSTLEDPTDAVAEGLLILKPDLVPKGNWRLRGSLYPKSSKECGVHVIFGNGEVTMRLSPVQKPDPAFKDNPKHEPAIAYLLRLESTDKGKGGAAGRTTLSYRLPRYGLSAFAIVCAGGKLWARIEVDAASATSEEGRMWAVIDAGSPLSGIQLYGKKGALALGQVTLERGL